MKNENVLFHDNYSTTSCEEDNLDMSILKILKDDSSTRSSSDLSFIKEEKNKKYFTKLKFKSSRYIFPLIYFASSVFFLFNLLFVNIFEAEQTRKLFELMPMTPFPSLFIIKEMQPSLFSGIVLIVSISGFLNIWCFCSLLIQRFSVPELQSDKLMIHLMFILGILGNISFIFFGCSPELLSLEINQIKNLRISLSMMIFLSYLFFNMLFGAMTMLVLENFREIIAFNDKRLKRNIRTKKVMISMAIFVMLVYISALAINFNYKSTHIDDTDNNYDTNNKSWHNQEFNYIFTIQSDNYIGSIHLLLFVIPFFLFALNAVLNLSYYFDISYMESITHMIIDKDYFLTNDESILLLSNFPV